MLNRDQPHPECTCRLVAAACLTIVAACLGACNRSVEQNPIADVCPVERGTAIAIDYTVRGRGVGHIPLPTKYEHARRDFIFVPAGNSGTGSIRYFPFHRVGVGTNASGTVDISGDRLTVDISFPIHQGAAIVQTRYELNGTYVVGVCDDSTRKSLPTGIE